MTLSPVQEQQLFYMASCNPNPEYLATLYNATTEEQLMDVAAFITDKLPKLQYEQTAIQQQIDHFTGVLATINANIALLTPPVVTILSGGNASNLTLNIPQDTLPAN